MMKQGRVVEARSFVLHTQPYRETSLLVHLLSREHGQIFLIAKGGRRPRSALRGNLMAFHPLAVSWYGKNEVRNLSKAEWLGGLRPLRGRALMLGYYLNELLLKALPREDPHPILFDHYEQTLAQLQDCADIEPLLRTFELSLLRELGYGPTLDRENDSGLPLHPQQRYYYQQERGLKRASAEMPVEMTLSGQDLLYMAAGDFSRASTKAQAKVLSRAIFSFHFHGQSLHARRIYRDLQQWADILSTEPAVAHS